MVAKAIALHINATTPAFAAEPIDSDLVELAALTMTWAPAFGRNLGRHALDDCMKPCQIRMKETHNSSIAGSNRKEDVPRWRPRRHPRHLLQHREGQRLPRWPEHELQEFTVDAQVRPADFLVVMLPTNGGQSDQALVDASKASGAT